MHSRIFQMSLEPIETNDYITESDYCDHWFVREWADYVSDDCNRNEDIEWLKESSKGISFDKDNNGEYLIVTSKKEYFIPAYENFIKALDKIGRPTIKEFVNGIDLWYLKNANEDKFGFYVDADGELMTFDTFIRKCVTNEKYYIGGTVDYHF